ncbi:MULTISPECIES: SLC13 family permease [Mycolicibacterium]|jgi:Na+/H+ antiporter NhaD/arsenite permease-like protein|uniref:SLC13 family permease n=1 Tax=Mycolicibacterium TaxID=1866885 RepID=UPI0007E96846|nr:MULTISPECIES: SLC13 family permease [Mycolicibacterium]OBA98549.1 C4-dicarboxylate ABC transporter [Mycolicibacterium fortuitum]OBI69620.1 C4-dicarboxylate ABC transporter [Mycolicibacterium fortuitum]OBK08923.1 C4-dicarboxylate ABC transporter [Mycolicibacterium fortuitum]OMC10607.1 C4-dicarboxylate ABC transporter [Mycolicibacterium fortuitum]
MTIQLLALAIFVGVFAVSAWRNAHLGVLMFAAASGVGLALAGMPIDDVIDGFPIDILVLLVGVTYFFGIAHANGTIDRLIELTLARVGHRTVLLPLVFFLLTAAISAMGSPLGGLVMAPIGMMVADKRAIDPMLMALSIGTGLSAGAFAPTSLFGIVTYGTAHQAGIDLNPFVLLVVAVVVNLVLLAVAYVLFGGLKLQRSVVAEPAVALAAESQLVTVGGGSGRGSPHGAGTSPALPSDPERNPFTPNQIATVTAMVGLIGTVIGMSLAGMDPDIGVLAFALGAVLTLIDPQSGNKAIPRIDWSTVLLVGGIITFVGVLDNLGSVDLLGEFAGHIGVPLLSALFICLVAGLVSAFASTTGMLAALVPLALPLVAAGGIPGWALMCALGVCASIVDVSPFSTVGATLVATTVDEAQRPRMTRLLMRWGLSMVLIGPVLLVGALVVPGTVL